MNIFKVFNFNSNNPQICGEVHVDIDTVIDIYLHSQIPSQKAGIINMIKFMGLIQRTIIFIISCILQNIALDPNFN